VGDETFAEMQEGRDHWWHRLKKHVPKYCAPEVMDAEDLLFILYTSGTTGKPKGIVHTTGGYLTGVASTKHVFDLKDDDVFWCTADIGWITGHSYLVYGPLANGATCVMYEGARLAGEGPLLAAVRALRRHDLLHGAHGHPRLHEVGRQARAAHDLSRLRLLGSVGEPINPEAWMWYQEHIGQGAARSWTRGGRRRRAPS
jgi:acetyl-CoA synthetase